MKGKQDLRVPTEQGRKNYDKIKWDSKKKGGGDIHKDETTR